MEGSNGLQKAPRWSFLWLRWFLKDTTSDAGALSHCEHSRLTRHAWAWHRSARAGAVWRTAQPLEQGELSLTCSRARPVCSLFLCVLVRSSGPPWSKSPRMVDRLNGSQPRPSSSLGLNSTSSFPQAMPTASTMAFLECVIYNPNHSLQGTRASKA